jgi:hypothetical protein
MDDKWRKFSCTICRGYGLLDSPMAWFGFTECGNCNEGTVWIRPKGHAFQYPGGPACGMWGPEYYDKATPVMPWEYHVLNVTGCDDPWESNEVFICSCGWSGTIKEHESHYQLYELMFIESRKSAQKVPEPKIKT